MHTRRFGAFIIGLWFMGSIVTWFAQTQSLVNAGRILSSTPASVQKELTSQASDFQQRLLRYQALEFNRRMREMWDALQLGIGGALLASAVLTSRRSRVVITATLFMMAIVAFMTFYLAPAMAALERAFSFATPLAAWREREEFASLLVWRRVLEILKSGLGLLIAGRLILDLQEIRSALSLGTDQPLTRRSSSMRAASSSRVT